jgi:hypothetical protein
MKENKILKKNNKNLTKQSVVENKSCNNIKSIQPNTSNQENVNNVKNYNNFNIDKKSFKMPPINVINSEMKDIVKIIKENLNVDKNSIYIKKIHNNKHAIYVNSLDIYKKVKEALDLIEANYYSYTPQSEKNKSYILKDMCLGENENDILEYLNELQCENVKFVKVSRFSTAKSRRENRILPLFLVQISAESNSR